MRIFRSMLPAALLFAAGCSGGGSPPSQVCTLIGCESGLEVTVQAAPAAAYRVVVTAPGQTEQSFDCPAGQQCTPFFRDFTPETATVRIIAAGDTTTASVRPTYRSLQPNGPDCPPTCRRATVTVTANDDG